MKFDPPDELETSWMHVQAGGTQGGAASSWNREALYPFRQIQSCS